jgi:NAD+ synthase (glutamine-hydrolysing)
MKLALIPVDVTVGDFEGNLKIHRALVNEAAKQGASFLVFPELSLVGYFPKDFLSRPSWNEKAARQLADFHDWLQANHPELGVLVGTTVAVEAESISPRGLANCAIFLHGKQKEVRAKTLIPFYDVFHESRYFDSAEFLPDSFRAPINFAGKKIGVLICEDSWHQTKLLGRSVHRIDPALRLKEQGVELLVNLSASPFDRQKKVRRRETIRAQAQALNLPLAYVNHFGAQDEILFDGDAFLFSAKGEYLAEKEEASSAPLAARLEGNSRGPRKLERAELRDLRRMVVVGIRDYAKKNGFERAVLGLSGGIDSALVATLACEALGPQNVLGLTMPSKFSSVHSIEDAESLSRALGLTRHHLPIKMPHSTFAMALKPFFEGLPEDVTEENLQSRLRGVAVMAFANKFRALALATGNKSEFAMGYSTLYGDMCGALAPIGDFYKGEVYELARFLNEERAVIPESTLTKAPSAELKPNQTDQDTLPPYDLLDAALRLLVEQELDPAQALPRLKDQFPIADLALLERIQRALALSEYKRKQAPPILRISPKAFGGGRCYPLTGRF